MSKILGLIYIETGLMTLLNEKFIKYKEHEYQLNNKIVNNKVLFHLTVFVIAFVFWLFLLINQHSERMKYFHEIYKSILA